MSNLFSILYAKCFLISILTFIADPFPQSLVSQQSIFLLSIYFIRHGYFFYQFLTSILSKISIRFISRVSLKAGRERRLTTSQFSSWPWKLPKKSSSINKRTQEEKDIFVSFSDEREKRIKCSTLLEMMTDQPTNQPTDWQTVKVIS